MNSIIKNNVKRQGGLLLKIGVWLLVAGVIFFVIPALSALAQAANPPAVSPISEGLQIIQQPLGLPATDIRIIIANVIKVALGLLGTVMVILLLYAGFIWMTAGGNEEKIGEAKKILTNAVIGLIIILSAYGIVLFVMKLLGVGTGAPGGPGVNAPLTQNFKGSGALGKIIKDHYPARNQTKVPRNTKIIITFRLPIKPNSLVLDTNGSKVFGDCVNIGQNMSWDLDCDKLILDNDHVNIEQVDIATGKLTPIDKVTGAATLAQYQTDKNNKQVVYTVVFKPIDYLGNSAAETTYLIHVGNKILLDDEANKNPGIFDKYPVGSTYYEWQFTVSTELDTTPPYVLSVFPDNNTTEAKNSVIQIDFNEAMDPTGVQGQFKAGDKYYFVEGNNIFLKSDHSTIPLGDFNLTNGYRTLEFTPSIVCGKNACGDTVYCLPVCDQEGAKCKQDKYSMIAKAGVTLNNSSFEAIPFSGLMDIAGNAMDANKDGKIDRVDDKAPVFPDWAKFDNYFWNFNISDELDVLAPYLNQITPGLDAEYIKANNEWSMLFSKRMRVDPMYDIPGDLTENPTPAERGDKIPLCGVPRVSFNLLDKTTLTNINHCPFLDGLRQYYYPIVTSKIQDVHFNCFYPGKGPGGEAEVNQKLKVSSVCGENDANCCAALKDPVEKAFCCNGLADENLSSKNLCNEQLIKISPR